MAHPTWHGTLVANTVTTVNLDVQVGAAGREVVVAKTGGPDGRVWYTLDGTTPAANAAGTYVLTSDLPAASHQLHDRGWGADDDNVEAKIVSTVAAECSVLVY